MRLKLTLAYDGTDFRGWAAQPGLRTVEGVVRDAFGRVWPEWNSLAVAGRTDTGVHALANVVSVWDAAIPLMNEVKRTTVKSLNNRINKGVT